MDRSEPRSHSSEEVLCNLLAALRALQQLHQTAHWSVHGEPFYGDHLLYQRLYEEMDAEFDTLAEKIVAYFDETSVNFLDQLDKMRKFAAKWEAATDCYVERTLVAERHLQDLIKDSYEVVSDYGEMSLGLDDYLMALANDHETNIYLIQQKVRCDCDAE